MSAEKSLSQFLDNLDDKVLECAVCLKRLQQPTTLPCLHAFCLSCLQNWVKKKDGLVCPTCSHSYTIPEGGLQKLPPNTFILNLLESVEQLEKRDKVNCLCGKNYAVSYCQDCKKGLCSSCKDHHKLIPVLIDHVLHSIEDVQSMTPLELSSLNVPQCSIHKNKSLEFYCKVCEMPICTNCALTDHKEWEGKHKHIDITKAFKGFQERTVHLKQDVENFTAAMKAKINNVQHKLTRLDKNKQTCRNEVTTFAKQMINSIRKMEESLLKELDVLYPKQKKSFDIKLDELSRITLDVNTRWNYISQLLKSNKATALQSSHKAMTSLQETMKALVDTEPESDDVIHFMKEKKSFSMLQKNGIGYIVQNPKSCFKIPVESLVVTKGQMFILKLCEGNKTDGHITSRLTFNGLNIKSKVEHQDEECTVTGTCPNSGVYKLDVSLNNEPITGSPLLIIALNEGLHRSFEMKQKVTDVVMTNDGEFLVAYQSNQVIKIKDFELGTVQFNLSIPKSATVNRMHKLKNGNIIFSDRSIKCITICNPGGQVIKSIGKSVLRDPWGVVVNKHTNMIYAADSLKDCVFVFDPNDCLKTKTFGSRGDSLVKLNRPTDITLTKEGNVIVASAYNHKVQMFDSEGSFLKVLVENGTEDGKVKCPCGVLIDKEENLLVASEHKLQLFSKDGEFIKRISKECDGLRSPYGLCIMSQYPRRVVVANWGNENVKIFNY
ncbi:E3 ubiquitin-protein ligase TRIM71-like [Anneissia japonica]|uniref:E3 ubiquitin-protein ligase TRIM71-like n=1 Tax=Anneissia japonica TaxID=1529436 RepID=UPI001425934E|nr:E3 ubiquitin-protein ligase TRIM71-like [Anneissia japonica]